MVSNHSRRLAPSVTTTELKVQIEPVKEQLIDNDVLPDGKFTRMDSAGLLIICLENLSFIQRSVLSVQMPCIVQ